MKHLHLLLKPSSGMCNLNCRYCFYHDIVEKRERGSFGFMSEATLETVIQKALHYGERECTIAFQGGEPTLAGLDFFQKAVALQKKHNVKGLVIHNAIQTNGLLLNEAWAAFLRENNFLVGISLDGVKEPHDCNRVDPRSEGTFSRVMETVRLLERYGVDFNILTVVNRQTARHAGKIYRFYQKNGLRYLQFIPCLDPLGEQPGGESYSLSPQDYGKFLNSLFDLWYQDIRAGRAVSVRQFESYVEMLLGYPPATCGMSGVCGYQHVVEADGSVYPCDFYVLEPYCLGNLHEVDFAEINRRREELGFVAESRVTAEACGTCRFYPLCRGGCRRHRPGTDQGGLGLNYFCESYKMFFAYAGGRLTELARMAARY